MPEPVNAADYGSPGVVPAGAPVANGLVITELMYDPASMTGSLNEWEWIEVYNAGPAIDFGATPLWLDDDDTPALADPNLTEGAIAAGGVAVLFNADAASLNQMRTAWDRPGRAPINWIAVEDWPSLANGGDLIGLWDNAIDYAADQGVEDGSIARAVAGIAYDDSAPWPTGVDGEAVRLANLSSDPTDPAAWARARGAYADPDAYRSADVLEPGGVIDNAGGDQASPGYHWPGFYPPLPGDYTGDGVVDAADYTMWRDGLPLPTETVSAGITDEADGAVWRANYRGSGRAGVAAAPEPATVLMLITALACGGRRLSVRSGGFLTIAD